MAQLRIGTAPGSGDRHLPVLLRCPAVKNNKPFTALFQVLKLLGRYVRCTIFNFNQFSKCLARDMNPFEEIETCLFPGPNSAFNDRNIAEMQVFQPPGGFLGDTVTRVGAED